MRRIVATSLLLFLAACSNGTEPGSIPLAGTWVGQPALLGIDVLTLTLTEQGADFTGSGTFTSTTAGAPNGAVTLTGFQLAGQLQATMDIQGTSGDLEIALTGAVEAADRFYLLFPTGQGGERVAFVKQ